MKLNSFFIIICFLTLLLFGAGAFLWKFAEVPAPRFYQPKDINSSTEFTYKEAGTWFEKVAMFAKKDYVLPTNLMLIEIDGNSKFAKGGRYFELLLDKCDFYSIFCINRVTKEFGVDSTVMKKGDESLIYLNTDNKNIAQNIVLNLKKYNIHSRIKED
ncbi:hypothetical protein [Campylobacter hyointestinalis]|uniref:hypothetical protein n=1 Tax=Campylobacter hyointestinalis TaxID=198 RepID=UPI000DCEB9BC|nr:hypothetical protein [Campylobacter hyointestinalis]RAZ52955.1 hypothetical protein CHL10075_00325 [Campylobacter hyointestinalis subsp. lawsonii]RAZ61519.1 hypothetical protein CHL10071_01090 [Campylobacter hyointestinalis subsp. lawsonii]